MTTKHATKNDLSPELRSKMAELLNARLADAIDLALQAKQAHWNVKGPHFIALHELFDKVYGSATEWVDTIAERAVILGGTADGTLAGVARRTSLRPYDTGLVDGRAHVDALSSALAVVAKNVRSAIDEADRAGDADTADLFTGISRDADKMLWFVEAHLQADR